MSDGRNPTTELWCRSCGAVFTPPQKCDCERAGMSELANHTPQNPTTAVARGAPSGEPSEPKGGNTTPQNPLTLTYDALLRDNDPRRPNRVLQVTGFEGDVVFAKERAGQSGRLTRIKLDRIHTDGKPRRNGWSVVNV